MKEKEVDGLREQQKKYQEKAKPYSELEQDAGGLGKNRASYEKKRRAGGAGKEE
jgi:hypothetical protein